MAGGFLTPVGLMMLVVEFPSMRLVEHLDVLKFQNHVSKWLSLREAENSYLFGIFPQMIADAAGPTYPKARMFTLEDRGAILAVAVLFVGGCILITWASDEMLSTMTRQLYEAKAPVKSVYGPCDVSWEFAKLWSQLTKCPFSMGRLERLYQLTRVAWPAHANGRLEQATPADTDLVTHWMEGFIKDAEYENKNAREMADSLINGQSLYLWKAPNPVSMVAAVAPTPRGNSINFVYTPPEFRRKGHGTAAVAALAQHLLDNGRRYCFIFTDPDDYRTNNLYQKIGARTLCEFMRCSIEEPAPQPNSGPGITARRSGIQIDINTSR